MPSTPSCAPATAATTASATTAPAETGAGTAAADAADPDADGEPGAHWWVVVPVKDTARGKSRIAAPAAVRTRLARALATDTLTAAVTAPGVAAVIAVVETDADRALALAIGARSVPAVGSGLGAAVEAGIAAVPAGAPVAVLLGDVPAARPTDLAAVLASVRPGEAVFVADAAGTGTTLVAARGPRLNPLFGPESARAHRRAGFRDLVAGGRVPAGLRHDVDTAADLAAVSPLLAPTGRATGALLAEREVRAALTVA